MRYYMFFNLSLCLDLFSGSLHASRLVAFILFLTCFNIFLLRSYFLCLLRLDAQPSLKCLQNNCNTAVNMLLFIWIKLLAFPTFHWCFPTVSTPIHAKIFYVYFQVACWLLLFRCILVFIYVFMYMVTALCMPVLTVINLIISYFISLFILISDLIYDYYFLILLCLGFYTSSFSFYT